MAVPMEGSGSVKALNFSLAFGTSVVAYWRRSIPQAHGGIKYLLHLWRE
jgi:hypothetical protein